MKIEPKVMEKAKPHLEALKQICADAGCSMEDLMSYEPEMDEGMEDESSEEMGEGKMKGPDKGKIALIIAKMGKPKGYEE